MKTERKRHLINLALCLLLIATLISAALPQTALAATCASYHIVKDDETTAQIAQTYGMKWRLIAEANKLTYPYNLKTGQKLCIPPKTTTTSPNIADSLKMTVKATGNNVTVTLAGLSAKAAFYVRVRDGNSSVGGWYKLGVFRAKKNVSASQSFTLPKELRDKLYLQVCLKNGSTDELACRTVVHR